MITNLTHRFDDDDDYEQGIDDEMVYECRSAFIAIDAVRHFSNRDIAIVLYS